MAFGAVNMLVGNLMALRQDQVKRLLAYSSIAHIGYILVGIGIGVYSGIAGGAQGGFFHLINHGMMKGLAFLSAGAWLYALHISTGNHEPLKIKDLAGASQRYPFIAVTFSLAVLGLGGIPPLSGFMSKWQILVAGFQTQNVYISLLAVFTAFNSILSLAYYAPLVNAIYKRETSPAVEKGARLPGLMYAPLALLAISILVLGIWPNLVDWLTSPAGAIVLSGY
jgi:formate hydrogenlyase subunit 3/multisubunit Na+/H+ antiporter MnhD subunit